MSDVIFKPFGDNPEYQRAADVASLILDHYEKLHPEWEAEIDRRVAEECARQIFYGAEPSEGLPGVRPRYLRYDDFKR